MRALITKDFGWKLFSLALAVIIWLTVKTISSEAPKDTGLLVGDWTTRSFTNLPVLVVSSAADVREFKVNPDYVDLKVSGRPEVMTALQEKEIRVVVDVTDIEAVRGILRKRVDVSTPPGVTLVRVTPADVSVVTPPKRNRQP